MYSTNLNSYHCSLQRQVKEYSSRWIRLSFLKGFVGQTSEWLKDEEEETDYTDAQAQYSGQGAAVMGETNDGDQMTMHFSTARVVESVLLPRQVNIAKLFWLCIAFHATQASSHRSKTGNIHEF